MGADETPIRVGPGPKTRKKYLLVACTSLLACYFLGDRDRGTFDGLVLGDLPDAVAVHDRYQNYDACSGLLHQLCCAHLVRDLEDAARSCPDAIWPGQAADALRALIHAANEASDQGLDAIPADAIAADLRLFRHAVNVGLQQVRRVPGARARQAPGRGSCRNASKSGRPTSCASCLTCGSPRHRTRPGVTCGPRRPSRRPPAASAQSVAGHSG